MSDEPTTETPAETPAETEPTKRTVRRVKDAPSPLELKKAREKRLHEALLENSRRIHDDLVTWDLEDDLEIPVTVEKEFDGNKLAAHYAAKGYAGCKFQMGVDPEDEGYVEIDGGNGVLVFPPLDLDALEDESPSEPEPAPEPPDPLEPPPAPRKAAKKTSRKAAKRTSGGK